MVSIGCAEIPYISLQLRVADPEELENVSKQKQPYFYLDHPEPQ